MNDDNLKKTLMGSVYRDPSTGCWVWSRQIANSGYGRLMLRVDGETRYVSAHRASYSAFVGPLADHQLVRHSCGNRLCVNPEHLLLSSSESSP
jgi:hypothetical protein